MCPENSRVCIQKQHTVDSTACFGGFDELARLFLVNRNPLGKRIPVNSEHSGGLCKVMFVAFEGFHYVELFKLVYGLLQQYLAVQHVIDQGFQAFAHISEVGQGRKPK